MLDIATGEIHALLNRTLVEGKVLLLGQNSRIEYLDAEGFSTAARDSTLKEEEDAA